jgi:negative regulator of flagellin synthesis FlgM
MKIDPNIQFPSDPQSDRLTTNSAGKAAQTNGSATTVNPDTAAGEDTFSLSSTHGDVQTLTANLANVPEVRAQRVSALQQQISNGTYQPDSSKVADAIIADQAGRKQ